MQLPTSAAARRFTIPCALAALAGLAGGQDAAAPESAAQEPAKSEPAILGRDNAQFARRLFERGLADLAEGVCTAIETSGEKGPEAFATMLLRLELRLKSSGDEADVTKRKDEIKSVLADMEGFISEYPRTPEAGEARLLLPDVYRQLGEALTAAVQKESDPAVVAALRAEGQKAFTDAEEALRARIKQFAGQRSDPDVDLQYADRQHMLAAYNLARTSYFHALLYPKDDPQSAKLFKQALKAFLEFGLDYDNQLLNYEGMVYQGLCSKALGETEDALLALDDAIGLRETYAETAEGLYDIPGDASDIVCSGVLQKVLLQTELGDPAAAVATAKDYFETIPDALRAQSGLALLAAMADAQLAAHDVDGASESAQRLSDLDPTGRWGARGRDILGKMVGGSGTGIELTPERMLKVAETMLGRKDCVRALEICAQARLIARGTPAEADIGSEAFLLSGIAYYMLGREHQASLAFDLAHELYPSGNNAAEALSRAGSLYQRLNSEERRTFFRTRYEDRLRKLADKYPEHPNAASAQLIEGKALEDEQDFLKAAELYRRIQPGSQAYEEAQFRAANCLFLQASALLQKGETEQAQPYLDEAEALLKKHQQDSAAALQRNLDPEVQRRVRGLAFAARTTLAQLYLLPQVGRADEVAPLLAGVEQEFAGDPEKIGQTWSLRIQALNAEGRLDEAVATLDALRMKDPDAVGLDTAAGILARALDQAAVTKSEAEPGSPEADAIWRSAAQYYLLSIRPQVQGRELMRQSSVDVVASRLYVFGTHFNGVPAEFDTFVGWDGGAPKEPQYWEQAAGLYEALNKTSPSYKAMIGLGRNYGFLARWKDASDVYARLFDQEPLLNRTSQTFDRAVVSAKPMLVYAYMEWGAAEHMLAREQNDKERFGRAYEIFVRVENSSSADDRLWWQAKYYQALSLIDRGDYANAKISLNNIARTTQDYDQGRFGYKAKFLDLRGKLK